MSLVPCTTPDCENRTATYLCHRCTEDLQAWLDKIPELVNDLHVTVARLDKVRKHSEGRSGSKSGSAAPINLAAFEIRWYLEAITLNAADHAKDPEAATIAKNIQDAVNEAELLVLGPPIEQPDIREARKRLEGSAEPMPTRKLVPYLRQYAKIHITGQNIRDWARRDKIRPIERTPSPTYNPIEVLDAWHETRREHTTQAT